MDNRTALATALPFEKDSKKRSKKNGATKVVPLNKVASIPFLNEKFDATMFREIISNENGKREKGRLSLNKSAEALGFIFISLTKLEMAKLAIAEPELCAEYFSDKYPSLPVETNNPQLIKMFYHHLHDCEDYDILMRKKSSIWNWRNQLQNIGFFSMIEHLSKITVDGVQVERNNGRAGFRVWIPKRFFGLNVSNNAISDNLEAQNSALSIADKVHILNEPTSNIEFTNVNSSFEIEESKSGDFSVKSQESLSAIAEIGFLNGFSNNRDESGKENAPGAAAVTELQPSPAAIANKKAHDLALFGGLIAEKIEKEIYDKYQPTGQVVISKIADKLLEAPLSTKQIDRIYDGSINILTYFAKKMPLADAFKVVCDGIKTAAKDLKRNKQSFVFMPENWLCVQKDNAGVFRMKVGSLRFIIENWNCGDKVNEVAEIVVNQSVYTIYDTYFNKLAVYGMTDVFFRKQLNLFAKENRLDHCVAAIDDFLRKIALGKIRRENKIGYLRTLWKDAKYNEKVEFNHEVIKEKTIQQQREAEYDLRLAKSKAEAIENAERQTKATKQKTQFEQELDICNRIARENFAHIEKAIGMVKQATGMGVNVENWQLPMYVGAVINKLKLIVPNEFVN